MFSILIELTIENKISVAKMNRLWWVLMVVGGSGIITFLHGRNIRLGSVEPFWLTMFGMLMFHIEGRRALILKTIILSKENISYYQPWLSLIIKCLRRLCGVILFPWKCLYLLGEFLITGFWQKDNLTRHGISDHNLLVYSRDFGWE